LENQLRRFVAQADRIAVERETLAAQSADEQLAALADSESTARLKSEELADTLAHALEVVQSLRSEQIAVEGRLEAGRKERERIRAELMSLEALQKAALSHEAGGASEWLSDRGLGGNTRVAQTLEVEAGWERAVETVLGSYLEAVSVDALDDIAQRIDSLQVGTVSFFSAGASSAQSSDSNSLLSRVQGPSAISALLTGIIAVDSLPAALERRHSLSEGQSIITRDGVWIGRDWLRVSRDKDVHAGVIEREKEMGELRERVSAAEEQRESIQSQLVECREGVSSLEQRRDELQGEVNRLHRAHSEVSSQVSALRAKAEQTSERMRRVTGEIEELDRDHGGQSEAIAEARIRLQEGLEAMGQFEDARVGLESEREERRQGLASTRSQAQLDRDGAQDVAIKVESRRSSLSSISAGLDRLRNQLEQYQQRRDRLTQQLADGEAQLVQPGRVEPGATGYRGGDQPGRAHVRGRW